MSGDTAASGGRERVCLPRRAGAATLLVAAAIALAAGPAAFATSLPAGGFRVQQLCRAPGPGDASCMGLKLVPAELSSADLQANAQRHAAALALGARPAVEVGSAYPGYLTPQRLHAAYALPTETAASATQTVAVIDAYDDPTVESDLAVYDREFGLPPCTAANGCFKKVNEEGNAAPLPPTEGGWAGEISIDVQMAHAICQTCHVLLVEASSEEFSDLGAAVDTAVRLGASEISNSYGAAEEAADTSLNSSDYDHPGLVVTVSSGDCGYLNKACGKRELGANFPADSPDVVAVGGTSLTESSGVWTSTVWADGGSGCSTIFSAQLWQETVANWPATGCGTDRAIADVSAIANPNTGVDVYDSTPEEAGAPTGWTVYGGTSVASPIVAAEFALAGGAGSAPYPAATLYAHVGESATLYDVSSGSNGKCTGATICAATVGYDGPSGVGSPIGLGAFSAADTPVDETAPTISGIAEQGETLTEEHGEWTNGPTYYSYRWQRCNAAGSSCAAIEAATHSTYTLTAGDVGSTIRVQETASNEHGGGQPASSAPTAVVSSDVPAITGITPGAGITGSEVTITGRALGDATQVSFGSLHASFSVVSQTRLEATVPNGDAKHAKISVTTPSGRATSRRRFAPTLSVTSLSPSSAHAGELVTIKGIGFNSSSQVDFNGTPAADVTLMSSKRLLAKVPAGASSGAVSVTNTAAPAGTVISAHPFSVS